MVKLFDKETGHTVVEITESQLQFLMENLEEESSMDNDYYFNEVTINMLKEKGADEKLITILEKAISNKGEAELRWERG
ncbi:MAG TPA: galactosyldiacylglycerol synthase [bacterium]